MTTPVTLSEETQEHVRILLNWIEKFVVSDVKESGAQLTDCSVLLEFGAKRVTGYDIWVSGHLLDSQGRAHFAGRV